MQTHVSSPLHFAENRLVKLCVKTINRCGHKHYWRNVATWF